MTQQTDYHRDPCLRSMLVLDEEEDLIERGDPAAPVVKNEDDNTLTEFGWGAFTREPPSY